MKDPVHECQFYLSLFMKDPTHECQFYPSPFMKEAIHECQFYLSLFMKDCTRECQFYPSPFMKDPIHECQFYLSPFIENPIHRLLLYSVYKLCDQDPPAPLPRPHQWSSVLVCVKPLIAVTLVRDHLTSTSKAPSVVCFSLCKTLDCSHPCEGSPHFHFQGPISGLF